MCSNCRDYEGPYNDNEERTEPPIVRGAASKGVASAPYDHSEPESAWEQERRLDWFIGFGLLTLLLAGWYLNKILAVWK